VQQSGSYVGPDRLRFDFTHYNKLTDEEINRIEELVNSRIRSNLEMHQHRDTPFEEAKKMGALMFFGDKYGDKVNVVQFGDFSMEFCGGTHVKNSSEIGLFKIVSESSIASGVRRIEAVTGYGAEKYIREQEEKLKKAEHKIEELSDNVRKLEKEIAEWELKNKLGGIDDIVNSPIDAAGITVYKGRVEAKNMDELKLMADQLRNKIKSGVGVLISNFGEKAGIVAIVSDDLLKDKIIAAGNLVGQVAGIIGGGGGGRPHMATAGGKDVKKISEALDEVEKIVENTAQK
jgi:alanyl-tRNA synthetase